MPLCQDPSPTWCVSIYQTLGFEGPGLGFLSGPLGEDIGKQR